ncbi:FabG Dehydrogenases with different specificities (related to short-chain alcohol dehydrogenases) [Candidatus Methylopumilus planktonicus]|uniref:SDR family NAD(P)-dependent oxidoreductase n=1 Tax=Candidatus Methylopumilus planktonicus TaxID=1581557 RepID=UPI003BEF167D
MNQKTIVITGASVGIGLEIAKKYLDVGHKVYTIARRNILTINKNHFHIQGDLSRWGECQKIANKIKKEINSLDVLINNVGKSEWRPIDKIDEAFFNVMMALNVASYVAITNGLFPILKTGSAIVNISSMAGKRGTPNNSIYCATKFAINGLTQSWAKEFGARGIRVNAICPVLIRSEGLEEALVLADSPAELIGIDKFLDDFKKSQSALGRLPTAQDVANFCYFLSSDNAHSISGQCINLDCGVFPQ